MNATLNTIYQRRSVRKFKNDLVDDDIIFHILHAATTSPSAMNRQSATIIWVKNPHIKQSLHEIGTKISLNKTDPFYNAPHLILVFGNTSSPCYIQDASLVLGTMFLAATSLNVDSCWINCLKDIFATKEGQAILDQLPITEQDYPIGACILGYRYEDDIPIKEHKNDYIKIV